MRVSKPYAWIGALAAVGAIGGLAASFFVSPRYVSTATFRCSPDPTFPQRLDAITDAVLSRSHLASLIDSLHLYAEDRQTLPLEDVIDHMQEDIHLG